MIKRRFSSGNNIYLLIFIGLPLVFVITHFIPRYSVKFAKLVDSVSDTTSFEQSPIYIGSFEVGEKKKSRHPRVITQWNDLLFVSYINSDIVEVFDDQFKIVNSYNFSNGRQSTITGITIDDDFIHIADHLNQEIRIYDHDGNIKHIFKWYPGSKQQIGCYGLFAKESMLYVTDPDQSNVLVISLSDVPGLNEMGELLFTIEGEQQLLKSPTAIIVTSDGRILVGDKKKGGIKVFTCDGRFIYEFGNKREGRTFEPNDFACDQMQSHEFLTKLKSQFETSRISKQGRIHVVDSKIARIKVYDALGKYILTYGKELEQPYGIAIDQKRRRIIVSDSGNDALAIYKY